MTTTDSTATTTTDTLTIRYEVHWARANRADEMVARRSGALRHVTLASAEVEANTIADRPEPGLVPIVVEVRTYTPAAMMR